MTLSSPGTISTPIGCNWFWGSHGCDLDRGHKGDIHLCGGTNEEVEWDDDDLGNEYPCSQYNSETNEARAGIIGDDGTFSHWSAWGDNYGGWQQ